METKDVVYAVGIGLTFLLGVINLLYTRSATRKADFIKTVTAERVKWIESLRQNVSNYIGKANHFRITRDAQPETAWKIVAELQVLTYVIKLQLNAKEEPDAQISRLIDKIADIATDAEKAAEYTSSVDTLTSLTQALLKKEWEKVKAEALAGKIKDL